MANPNTNWDQLTAVVDKLYLPKFPEQIFNSNLLMKMLHVKGTKAQGGNAIKQTLKYANSPGGAYGEWEELNVAAKDQLTAADFDWKFHYVSIAVSRQQLLKAGGPQEKKGFLEAKMDVSRMTLADNIATGIFSDGTTDTDDFNGLIQVMDDTSTVYGGIDATTDTWWKPFINTTATLSEDLLQDLHTGTTEGNRTPTLYVGHKNIVKAYNKIAIGYQRLVSETAKGLGFDGVLTFNGKPMYADSHARSSGGTFDLYALNLDFLDLVTHSKENMRLEGFMKPVNQNAAVAKIFYAGNLTCSNRRFQGNLSSLTG